MPVPFVFILWCKKPCREQVCLVNINVDLYKSIIYVIHDHIIVFHTQYHTFILIRPMQPLRKIVCAVGWSSPTVCNWSLFWGKEQYTCPNFINFPSPFPINSLIPVIALEKEGSKNIFTIIFIYISLGPPVNVHNSLHEFSFPFKNQEYLHILLQGYKILSVKAPNSHSHAVAHHPKGPVQCYQA